MSLLEVENTGEGTPQGVVLALVCPESDTTDSMRSLRMYNLASLISLAKWTVAQKSTITRSIKSLIEPVTNLPPEASSSSSLDSIASPVVPVSQRNGRLSPNRRQTDESSWDMVEDLPLRWATDFVPLATAGSRLLNLSVISYALWGDENRQTRGERYLAIATKNTILLYETPKGERAFRFSKEFYTPLLPRSVSFFQQSVQDINRSASDVGTPKFFSSHRRTESTNTIRAGDSPRASPSSATMTNYGTHLSLFVIFDKKAGWIRIADSAVGELELYDTGGGGSGHRRGSESMSTSSRRSRMSFDIAHHLPKWISPVRCTLPLPHRPGITREVMFITRGINTHIVPAPLPIGPSSNPPLSVVTWRSPPTSISARISIEDDDSSPPFLQLIGLGGEYGVEVQEVSLSFMGKGKGSAARVEEPLRAEEDLGRDSGFLCAGGHWDESHHLFHRQRLSRSFSAMSAVSANSFTSMESEDLLEKMKKEQGVYAWCQKGHEDWRVLWIGGSLTGDIEDDEGDDPDR
ncbi:hypothetical protein DXG01_007704 [Tephrocybe rancida]|nr:hypothetical protein DXG01_007704 [Tephrocybe rancida]